MQKEYSYILLTPIVPMATSSLRYSKHRGHPKFCPNEDVTSFPHGNCKTSYTKVGGEPESSRTCCVPLARDPRVD